MSKLPVSDRIYDDEINLISLIQTVWDGKWKIASIIAVSLLSVFGFNIFKPNTSFTALTEIKPITSFEFDKYSLLNSSLEIIQKEEKKEKDKKILNTFEITKKSLLSLYIEEIEEGSLLETGIDKFNLINKDDFNSEDSYKDAVEKFASEIELLKPIKEENKIFSHYVVKAQCNNKDKWREFLTFVNNEVNRKVKATIVNRFRTMISIQNQKKDLKQNINIQQAVNLFYHTPLKKNDFQAAILFATDFKINNKKNLYYALAIALGGIIGVVYVLIANAFKNRRTLLTNSW